MCPKTWSKAYEMNLLGHWADCPRVDFLVGFQAEKTCFVPDVKQLRCVHVVCFICAAIWEVVFICAKGGKFSPVGGTRKGLSPPLCAISLQHAYELQRLTFPNNKIYCRDHFFSIDKLLLRLLCHRSILPNPQMRASSTFKKFRIT